MDALATNPVTLYLYNLSTDINKKDDGCNVVDAKKRKKIRFP